MIQRVEVSSEIPALPIPVGTNISDDPVQFRGATGLEPVKAELPSTPFATRRGAYPQGSSVGTRNIVLTFGLNPNWEDQTISSLRRLLYAYFMPEQWCKLRFFTEDYPVLDIEGICESVEPNIFTPDPEMQVSIICHQPDFVDPDVNVVRGVVSELDQYVIEYEGTAPTGFTIRIKNPDPVIGFEGTVSILNEYAQLSEVFNTSDIGIDAFNYFRLRTIETARDVSTIDVETGLLTNKLKNVSHNSIWSKFRPGENFLSVMADGYEGEDLLFELLYFNRFGGL